MMSPLINKCIAIKRLMFHALFLYLLFDQIINTILLLFLLLSCCSSTFFMVTFFKHLRTLYKLFQHHLRPETVHLLNGACACSAQVLPSPNGADPCEGRQETTTQGAVRDSDPLLGSGWRATLPTEARSGASAAAAQRGRRLSAADRHAC